MKNRIIQVLLICGCLVLASSCSSTGRGTVGQIAKFGFRSEPAPYMTMDDDVAKIVKVDANAILRQVLENERGLSERDQELLAEPKAFRLENGQKLFSGMVTMIDTNLSEDQKRLTRNTFGSQLLAASEQNCEVYLQNLRVSQVGTRLVSDLLSTGLGLAGSLASPIDSARLLAAGSGLSTAAGASVDRNIFANQAVELIVDEIRKNRRVTRAEIETRLKESYGVYSISSADADIKLYHGQCSMQSGLVSMGDVIAKREAAINVIRATSLQAQDSDITGPALAKVIEGIADGFERSVGLPVTNRGKTSTATAAVEDSSDVGAVTTELNVCYSDQNKVKAAASKSVPTPSTASAGAVDAVAPPKADVFADTLQEACMRAGKGTVFAFLTPKTTKTLKDAANGIEAKIETYIAETDATKKEAALVALTKSTGDLSKSTLETEGNTLKDKRAAFVILAAALSNDMITIETAIEALKTEQGAEFSGDPFMSLVIAIAKTDFVQAGGTSHAIETGLAAGTALISPS